MVDDVDSSTDVSEQDDNPELDETDEKNTNS